MATNYTDVDRLILERWQDVLGLREAFDELEGRIREAIADLGGRLERWGESRGYRTHAESRAGEYHAWKPSWENRRGDVGLFFRLGGFAPVGYRKVDDDHPYVWLVTEGLAVLKIKDAERPDFVQELKATLGDRVREWENEDTDSTDAPLGKYFAEVSQQDRVALVADPDKLYDFAVKAFEEAFTLSEAIDQTLAKFRPGA